MTKYTRRSTVLACSLSREETTFHRSGDSETAEKLCCFIDSIDEPQTLHAHTRAHTSEDTKMVKACIFVVCLLAVVAATYGAYNCPKEDGQYEDSKQCDKYYECVDGQPIEKYCPDGLVFDPLNRKVNKCDHVFNVDCGDRLELQPPQPTKKCPRRNGFFAHPESSVCNVFYNCIDGEAIEITCTTGLHFDEYSGTCVWPDSAGRKGCGVVGKTLSDGFECPKESGVDSRGLAVDHPKFAHPDDCQKFYVCLNGVTPREQGCSDGTVYNEEQQRCDAPENVPGCEDWYKDDDKKP